MRILLIAFLALAAFAQGPRAPLPLSEVDATILRRHILAEQDAVRVVQAKVGERLAFEAQMREKYHGEPCDLTTFGTWVNCGGKKDKAK